MADRASSELTGTQRYDLMNLWVMLLEELYVHLPQKRALYGYNPIPAPSKHSVATRRSSTTTRSTAS